MVWENASVIITQYRTQLLACATVQAMGIVEADFHYPSLDIAGGDPIPAIKLVEAVQDRDRYAEGAIGLPNGTLMAMFYLPLDLAVNSGYCETAARQIILELMSQYYGLAFRSFETTLSSDPTPAQRAAGEEGVSNVTFRGFSIACNYGLDRG